MVLLSMSTEDLMEFLSDSVFAEDSQERLIHKQDIAIRVHDNKAVFHSLEDIVRELLRISYATGRYPRRGMVTVTACLLAPGISIPYLDTDMNRAFL